MISPRQILVTSALPYANGSIHLGHLVEYIQTDIWVRYQKLRGHNCYYMCADDTHGTAIMVNAKKQGHSPEELIKRRKEEYNNFIQNPDDKINDFFNCQYKPTKTWRQNWVEFVRDYVDFAAY